MKKRGKYGRVLRRTWAMATGSRREWPAMMEEWGLEAREGGVAVKEGGRGRGGDDGGREMALGYVAPLTVGGAACAGVLLGARGLGWWAAAVAGVNAVAVMAGWLAAWWAVRGLLAGRVEGGERLAVVLTGGSYGVFAVLHGLAAGLMPLFWGQLLEVGSLWCVHVLYTGLERLPDLDRKCRNNVLIVGGMLMVAVPAIAERLLTIVLRIPMLFA